jgi:MFS family permease
MVTYLDRVSISKLAPDIMRDLDLSIVQMGYVFSSFALAYAFFEIPTAWWADRAGVRAVLSRIVIWWSLLTMATAAAWNFASLLASGGRPDATPGRGPAAVLRLADDLRVVRPGRVCLGGRLAALVPG